MRRLAFALLVVVTVPALAATRLSETQAERAARVQAERIAALAPGHLRVSVRACGRVDARTIDCRVRYSTVDGRCYQTLRVHLNADGKSIRVTRGARPTRCVAD